MAKTIRGKNFKMDWLKDEVFLKVENANSETIRRAAFFMESEARQNIQRNGQIDTSFMINSGYVVTPNESTFARTLPSGSYSSRKQGGSPERRRAPKASLPRNAGALVAFGAVYAFWQELQQPFLFPALEMTHKQMGGIIEKVAREKDLK